MGVSGIGSTGYITGYEARRTTGNTVSKNFAGQMGNISNAKKSSQPITLHWFDHEDGDTPIGASAVGGTDGGSVTVYKPMDFDPANPVYKVKIWDAAGNVSERMVDISKVDPTNCDMIDMFVYSSHLTDSGECPNAQSAFLNASANPHGPGSVYGSVFDEENWVDIVKYAMQLQFDLGNMQGYLDYKKFWDFLQ